MTLFREKDSLVDTPKGEQKSRLEREETKLTRPEEQTPAVCTLEREEDTTVDRPEEQTTPGAP